MCRVQTKEHGNFDLSLRYSDYIKIFLMISLVAGNEDKIYTRLSDVIQCNMAHITKAMPTHSVNALPGFLFRLQ